MVAKIDVPELGAETEQTTDLQDYREVDGVKLPFTFHIVNVAQAARVCGWGSAIVCPLSSTVLLRAADREWAAAEVQVTFWSGGRV